MRRTQAVFLKAYARRAQTEILQDLGDEPYFTTSTYA